MNKVNILHGIPSPRDDIPQVLEHQDELPFDRFMPKFLKEYDAYACMRQFFLEHTEYTHLAVGTDDIVVTKDHINQLAKDLEVKDYPVLCGMMNVYQEDLQFVNITPDGFLPAPTWHNRHYEWIARQNVPVYVHRQGGNPIIKVGFNGFALMIIRRDIVEQLPFITDAAFNQVENKLGGSLDVQFCWQCAKLNIPIHTDTRVFLYHLRMSGTMRVGKEKPYCVFWPAGGKKQYFDVEF